MKNCVFDGDDKGYAVGIHSSDTVTVTNCLFCNFPRKAVIVSNCYFTSSSCPIGSASLTMNECNTSWCGSDVDPSIFASCPIHLKGILFGRSGFLYLVTCDPSLIQNSTLPSWYPSRSGISLRYCACNDLTLSDCLFSIYTSPDFPALFILADSTLYSCTSTHFSFSFSSPSNTHKTSSQHSTFTLSFCRFESGSPPSLPSSFGIIGTDADISFADEYIIQRCTTTSPPLTSHRRCRSRR